MRKIAERTICLWMWVPLIILSSFSTEASQEFKVSLVIDGDTVVLSDGRLVRYIGINAPEIAHDDKPAEYWGKESQLFNRRLVENKLVRLEYGVEAKDQYGRLLAYVFLRDGTFINGELVKHGCAYVLASTPNLRYHKLLLKLQQQAIDEKRGLWIRELEETEEFYVGNRRSRRFHRPKCAHGQHIAPQNRRVFKSKREVFKAGYSPCKKCLP